MGQVCQKCTDGHQLDGGKKKNVPVKRSKNQKQIQNSMMQSDMHFSESGYGQSEVGGRYNTHISQTRSDGSTLLHSQQTFSQQHSTHQQQQFGSYMGSSEYQQNQNQQQQILEHISKMDRFDQQTVNPIKTNRDKLLQLKLRNYMKLGSPPIQQINHLVNEPKHTNPGKKDEIQRGKGLAAHGEKKLITDVAFYEEVIIKFHFLNEIQNEIDAQGAILKLFSPEQAQQFQNQPQDQQLNANNLSGSSSDEINKVADENNELSKIKENGHSRNLSKLSNNQPQAPLNTQMFTEMS